jgi:mRNA interferase RelE/StbE
LPAAVVKKLSPAIDGLANNPRPKGCKKLQSQKENIWRIRVGDYRIVYLIEDVIKIVEIRRIAHRREVYD